LEEQGAGSAAAARPSLGAPLIDSFTGKLIRCRDGAVEPADASTLASKTLIAFYFSAHWCPPCRKFTPELVDYYNRVAPQHPEFELIFVSYDKSRFNWETYIRDTKMPWLAIDYDQLGGFEKLKQAGGDAIPSLLVLDEQNRVISSSYEAGKYVGPQNALAALDKAFAAGVK
jgi:nucleoredoxin